MSASLSAPQAVEVVRLPLDDAPWDWVTHPQEVRRIKAVADRASRVLAGGGTVLTTCNMGLNRSGLLTALILIRHAGLRPQQAIALLRERCDPSVLSNKSFCSFLSSC